ncbi:MAG: cobalamin-dependent protein, partial [Patescibacteria group bacterium]
MTKELPQYQTTEPVKVGLVSTFSPKHGAAIGESLGSEAIAGHLLGQYGKDIDVQHVDLQLDPDISELAQRIAADPPHILGVSVKIGAVPQLDEIMQAVERLPIPEGRRPLIVMGGVVPTFATLDLLRRYPDAIMITKEGE